jgi:hypothetical protein
MWMDIFENPAGMRNFFTGQKPSSIVLIHKEREIYG